jgi:hypothetical protein
MFIHLLDIAWPGSRRPIRPEIIIKPDTIAKPAKDSVTAPTASDSIIPQDFIDSCKENVIDTLHSAVNWLNGTGTDNGHSTLLWTSLVVLVSLSLCFYGVWSYRRQLQNKKRLA